MKRPAAPTASMIALCAAMAVADAGEDGAAPEWVHLLPSGAITTVDGRGPYLVKSLQAVADALTEGERLPIDECHSTDRAAPLGLPAPARGWIVELQAREDGVWGRVEWTGEGRKLMADKAYRGISPAILHDKAGQIVRILRASLVNNPNLQGLVALHSPEHQSERLAMDYKAMLLKVLGLDSSADDTQISDAMSAMKGGDMSLCSADLLRLPEFVALQSELSSTATELATLKQAGARAAAEAFVDSAIAAGRVGVKPVREHYITMHMADPAQAKALIEAMPALKGSVIEGNPPEVDASGLDATDRQVIALMGISEETYRAGLKSTGLKKEAL